MAKTYRRADDDFAQLVQRSLQRRHARKLAELAWGGAAIADQDYRCRPSSRIRA